MRGWTGFLVITLIFAVVTALAQNFARIQDTVQAGLIAFGAFALILGIPFWLFRRVANAGELRYGCGMGVTLGLMITGIVAVLSIWQGLDRMEWARGAWEAIAAPPVQAVAVLQGYTRAGNPPAERMLYIQGEDGQAYAYECATMGVECQWAVVESVPESPFQNPLCGGREARALPPPLPGAALGTRTAFSCGPDGDIQQHYAVLTDGTVWKWEQRTLPAFSIMQALAIVVGLVLGVLLGAMVNREYLGQRGVSTVPV
jgi:hypothetical protein